VETGDNFVCFAQQSIGIAVRRAILRLADTDLPCAL
jgi:hypothetical protein